MSNIIIITDLDGTLLNRQTYLLRDAALALDLIEARNIPLIFCSSKTRAEQEVYRKQLRIDHPFIVE
ncbi:MAG: HAD hydrolase family protein, partial [Candidatus Binatia bacterium]